MRYAIATFLCFLTLTAVAAPAATKGAAPAAPFDIKATTQAFQKTTSGGIQQVVAKDPSDKDLVAAIRAELVAEAGRFGNGDYSGITKAAQYLKAVKPGQIRITYRNAPGGAAVDYVGRDAAAVAAIHAWLDAEFDAIG